MPTAGTRRTLVQLFQVLCKVVIITSLAVLPDAILSELQQQTLSAAGRTERLVYLRHWQGGEQH